MTSKTFTAGTVIDSAWLNDVNDTTYNAMVSVTRFGALGDGVKDNTAAFAAAIATASTYGLELLVPPGNYLISGSIDLRNKSGFVLRGLGLPSIIMTNLSAPIIVIGGERNTIEGFKLQYSTIPTLVNTDAVAIRGYNLYESVIRRVYITQVFTGIDQYQGLVNGGQNAFYSNRLQDLRIINYCGWAVKLVPYNGGNSGNRWDNIYINNRGSSNTAAGSGTCYGGIFTQTSQNDVYSLINIEWMRHSGAALVLNQAGNPTVSGLHFEGLYPTSNYSPLIDILGGDNSCPTFSGITVTGCDFSGTTGAGLIRLDNQGTRAKVNGLLSNNNTSTANIGMLINAGTTCYGSYLEVDNANVDASFAVDSYSPKVSVGTVTANVEHPLQRWNLNIAKHSATVTDNAGGTQSSGGMSGTVLSSSFDKMGLWDAANNRFNIKQPGNYLCSVTIPSGSNPVVYVQKNYNNTSQIPVTVGLYGGGGSVQLQLARGDSVEFYLASGSYTKTNVTFGVSLAS